MKGNVPHEAIEMLKELPIAQNLLAMLVQYRRAAKTELMSGAHMQHNAKVMQQLQESLRMLLAPAASQNDHESGLVRSTPMGPARKDTFCI